MLGLNKGWLIFTKPEYVVVKNSLSTKVFSFKGTVQKSKTD